MLGLGTSLLTTGISEKPFLLDEVSDAVGAYSLRKLVSGYTGPAVRVRRTSDDAEKDIYFNGRVLDTATLEDFCSGTDGKVVRWYNQVYGEPTPLLSQSFGSSAAVALSTRKLDEGYTGPCMSVASSELIAGVKYTGTAESDFGTRLRKRAAPTYAAISPSEAITTTIEVYVDAPSRNGANSQVTVITGGNAKTQLIPQKTWTKMSFTGTATSQSFHFYFNETNDDEYKAGDQLFYRNLSTTSASYVIPTIDDLTNATTGLTTNGAVSLVTSYDVGFDSEGNLDTDRIDAFATAYKGGVLKLEVDDTLGDTDQNIGARKTFTAHTAHTTWSFEAEVYADCPSIGQNTNVEFGAQVGDHTVNAPQFTPTSTEQRKWTKVSWSRTSSGDQSFDNRVHFSIAGQGTPDQQLADGDRVYIRSFKATCAGDSSLSFEADFSSDTDGFVETSAGGGADEYDDFTLSHVTDPVGAVAVTKWCDQSGGGNDVVQVNHNRMPLIYKYDSTKDEYCITESNDKPAVELSEDAYFTETAFTGNTSTGLSVFLIGNRNEVNSSAAGRAIFALGPDGSDADADSTYETFEIATFHNILRVYRDGTEFGTDPNDYGQDDYSTGSTEASQTRQYALHATQKADKSGVANLDGGSDDAWEEDAVDHQGYDSLVIGSRVNTAGSISTTRDDVEYRLCELVFYDEDRSADAPDIRNNLNDYYRTYSAGDAIQTVIDDQPKIVSSGTVEKVGDVPVLAMANSFLDASGNSNLKTTTLDAYIYLQGADNGYLLFTAADGGGDYSFALQNGGSTDPLTNDYGTPNLYANNVEFEYVSGTTTRDALHTATSERAAALTTGSVEVHEGASTNNWMPGSPATFKFLINGYDSGDGGYYEYSGNIGELIFFDADKSSDRQFIQDSMQNHFQVKPFDAPLSQSYGGGAKSAYSLRKVNDKYTGPAIRVRNQFTDVERDIYFDSFGNLDIAGLESFANGSLLHCSKWYDQSGNGNHAVQTSEANQPRVTDGSGNAILENGRPRLHWVNQSGSTQTRMFANTNNSLLGLSRLDAYIAYNPSGDNNYILFTGNTSNAGGPFSYVATASETDITSLHSGYSNGNLYLDGSQITLSASTTRSDLSTALAGSNIQIEVHEGHSTNSGGWNTFGIGAYSGRGLVNGYFSEILLFGEDKSSNRTDLQDNMNNYYYAY